MNNSFDILFNKLGINERNGLLHFQNVDSWSELLSYRVLRAMQEIRPYALYLLNNTPVILFIDNTSKADLNKINSKVWNVQIPVIIIDNGNEWLVYNGFLLSDHKKLNELFPSIGYHELTSNKDIDNLTFWNLQSGKTWKIFESKFLEDKKKRDRKRLDTYLLENINGAINLLTNSKTKINHSKNKEIANNLIGRLIFVRYLIDRGVDLGIKEVKTRHQRQYFEDIILKVDELYALFSHLRDRFNGNLFPLEITTVKNGEKITEEEKNIIDFHHLEILHELFTGNDLNNRNQLSFISLFDIYDFNIIPIELISNIYEKFIGLEGQKENKSFYTPPFLVDYILRYTIEPHLKQNSECKVLDPSCGSGIFLVETLRKIIEKNIQIGKIKRFSQLQIMASGDTDRLNELVSQNDIALKTLVQNSIYGIDKDENAINIAKFSVYITLLDYKEPKEIEQFRLPTLEDNFIHANFFDKSILERLKDHNFNFIIGNPPWGSINDDEFHLQFLKEHENHVSDLQIAQSFVIQSSKLASDNSQVVFVLPSKGILYNSEAKKFRNFLWVNFELNRVLELSAVRRQIFTKAIAPTAILFLTHKPLKQDSNIEYHRQQLAKNTVHYISLKPNRLFKLFKVIVIEKYDYKKIVQKHFVENDWIWKVILYGSVLDFNYLKELYTKQEYINLGQYLDNNSVVFGTGFKTAQKYAKSSIDKLKDHLVVRGSNFAQFFILKKENLPLFKEEYPEIKLVDGKGVLEVYNSPHLLIKRGINKQSIVALSDFYCVFPDSVYGMYSKRKDEKLLKSIGALFSTQLFSYLLLNLSTQWGVERDEVKKGNYEQVPILPFSNQQKELVSSKFDEATKLAKEKFENPLDMRPDYNFDELFYQIYGVNKQQKDLIDYALNISIPLFRQKAEPFKRVKKEQIAKYTEVFTDFFSEKFKNIGKHLKIDVYYERREYVTVHIQIVEETFGPVVNFPEEQNLNAEFELIARIFSEPQKITNDLFIQKDIKGFEENSFYVVKPNEYKNWHPAIAHLDVNEFYDAIMKTGMKKQKEAKS
ncbi:Eco57I restriction-modification methylase domain-containing protein [Alkaliflexus imshenetskii]|uniref:Eco57I restriction-modification methylase domain-containing protein n=1 Tax=Alkaliflexus imshenetskii TaxID=286730 RepID=UPI00047D8BF5|nr:N-6 DNA methylase [Alkaliflexus imshenetskii]